MFNSLSKEKLIFYISIVVFLFLNIIENVIHFSHGRKSDNGLFLIVEPNKKDWFNIIVIMIIFAILQGLLTAIVYYFIHG